jgi:hypothetical protein
VVEILELLVLVELVVPFDQSNSPHFSRSWQQWFSEPLNPWDLQDLTALSGLLHKMGSLD